MEKRLRRDLKRTHALLSDVQLLLATMEDSKTSVSKEELEKVHSQVGVTGPLESEAGDAAAAGEGGMSRVMAPTSGPHRPAGIWGRRGAGVVWGGGLQGTEGSCSLPWRH